MFRIFKIEFPTILSTKIYLDLNGGVHGSQNESIECSYFFRTDQFRAFPIHKSLYSS